MVRDDTFRGASVAVVSSRQAAKFSCLIDQCRAVHIVGVGSCTNPACHRHHGVCLPVTVTLIDSNNDTGYVRLDTAAVTDLIQKRQNRTRFRNRVLHSAKAVDRLCDFSKSAPVYESKKSKHRFSLPADIHNYYCDSDWNDNASLISLRSNQCAADGSSLRHGSGILAELASEKRGGRVGPNPSDTSPGARRHHEAVQLFSELMQTDDVSTIAAQIANQAELIYQTWKTTGLNPTELIRYHSVTSETDSTSSLFEEKGNFGVGSGFPSDPSSFGVFSSQRPRSSVRNIGPASPGSLTGVPRKLVTDSSMQNGRYHSTSPSRSLNTSPRPYIPATFYNPSEDSTRFASGTNITTSSNSVLPTNTSYSSPPFTFSSPKTFTSAVSGQSLGFKEPPAPPERYSSYPGLESSQTSSDPLNILADPDLESSLRDLVNSFVIEDRARNSSFVLPVSPSNRPNSGPSSIQEALQCFERQMAITSRAASQASDQLSSQTVQSTSNMVNNSTRYTQQHMNTSRDSVVSSSSFSINTSGRRYAGARSDSHLLGDYLRPSIEQDIRLRRSVSPNPPVSQPGWNEPQSVSTSTWPLKNKQPSVATSFSQSVPRNPVPFSAAPSANYKTTLEARVDSNNGQYTGVPIRHKVVSLTAVDEEEERLMTVLRTGTLIEDGDHLRLLSSSRPSQHFSSNVKSNSANIASGSYTSSCSETTELPAQSRRPKFSISVTVDVDGHSEPEKLSQQRNVPILQSANDSQDNFSSVNNKEELSSAVDYAKSRFHESQQYPRTTQRMQDYRSLASKMVTTSDGRVMMARSRFETNGSSSSSLLYESSGWRGPVGIQADELGSSLPEFYRRKLRKMRKGGSPEPLVAGSISALPHPELTDQQKAHIRERSQSPTAAGYNSVGVAIRPYLTQGSVAERVLIFERAPTELKTKVPASASEKRRGPAVCTWRDPDEVRVMAQEGVTQTALTTHSSPSPIEVASSTTHGDTRTSQVYLRDSNAAYKENVQPLPITASASITLGQNGIASTGPLVSAGVLQATQLGVQPLSGPTANATVPPVRSSGGMRRQVKSAKSLLIPRFYYPMGRPNSQAAQEQMLSQISNCFNEHGGQVGVDNLDDLMQACQVPFYWKVPVFLAGGGERLGYLVQEQFLEYWARLISTCHDASSRFVRILSRGVRNFLVPEDFLPLVQDVVDHHPGLTFLKEATEFHSRYVHTVIARIYYCVNRSWSGRITVPELRRSNLLQVISYLEEEEDINQIMDYFSYEHFYVIYCKFWELDTDHDLFIDKHDLARHNEQALSSRIIDKIFSGAVTRGFEQKQDKMGYQEFVWFLISEEDKRHPTAIEYWFRCMDLDGDGYLSMYELEYFYEEQLQRMENLGLETLPFSDCLCQMLDMIQPEMGDRVSLQDLKRCRMTPIFFDTFFNVEKYLDHEQRDPFASQRGFNNEDGQESDWDRFAANEYELLVAEEGGADNPEEMLYGEEDELSMGCDDTLDSGDGSLALGVGGSLSKGSPLSLTVNNLSVDAMDVDEDYAGDDSDDYEY